MRLILNADDFGYTQGCNKGILSLAEVGSLTSTSVMANMPYAEQAQALIGFDDFSIGLHFNLTEGRPVLSPGSISSLVDAEGFFLGKPALVERIKRGQVNQNEVFSELLAQFSRLSGIVGEKIDHLDTHQGINMFGVIRNALQKFGAQQRVGAIRIYSKFYFENIGGYSQVLYPNLLTLGKFGLRRVLVEAVVAHWARQLGKWYAHPDGLVLARSHNTLELLRLLADADLTTLKNDHVLELSCHPAADVIGLKESKLRQARIEEYELLASERFRSAVIDLDLVSYSALC